MAHTGALSAFRFSSTPSYAVKKVAQRFSMTSDAKDVRAVVVDMGWLLGRAYLPVGCRTARMIAQFERTSKQTSSIEKPTTKSSPARCQSKQMSRVCREGRLSQGHQVGTYASCRQAIPVRVTMLTCVTAAQPYGYLHRCMQCR